jgi:TPR repeat protein
MHEDGRGVRRDISKATDLYMKACEGGVAFSCSYIGHLWTQDPEKKRFGIELLERGCDAGDTWGCEKLEAYRGDDS